MVYSPIIKLREFYRQQGWSRSTGERRRRTDPDFPKLVQIGVNRQGVREVDAAKYQRALQKRVQLAPPKNNAFDAERGRAAARISTEKRRAARLQREAEQKRSASPGAAEAASR
jgi:predicted DNA-binding transcriptional regulator AlpA